jgi:hypothetical protein
MKSKDQKTKKKFTLFKGETKMSKENKLALKIIRALKGTH